MCDAYGLESVCLDGLECFDGNQNGDGYCSRLMPGVWGDSEGGFEAERFDVWEFNIDGRQWVSFETSDGAGGCPADTVLYLFRWENDQYNFVVSNDDGGLNTCSLIQRVIEPGRYFVSVTGWRFGAVDAYVLTAQSRPVRPEGEGCDRAGLLDVCDEEAGHACVPSVDGPSCQVVLSTVDEVEPDVTTADAAMLTLSLIGTTQVNASLTAGEDAYDVFVATTDAAARVQLWTGNGAGGCPRDTEMYQIDGAILDAEGIEAAITADNRLGYDNDGGVGTCSRLDGVMDAGTHYFVVSARNPQQDIPAYVFNANITPVVGDGELCDAAGEFLSCSEGLACVVEADAFDGVCGDVNAP
jgi:hypothetical protein